MRLSIVGRVILAAAAGIAVALLVDRADTSLFAGLVEVALPWMPLLLLLEGGRIAADLVALRSLCGPAARSLSAWQWIRLHLVANAALVVLPGGRAVSEAMKVDRLRGALGTGRAVTLVVALHTTTLAAVACTSVVAVVAGMLLAGSTALLAALLAHAAVCVGSAIALRAALARATVPRRLARWLRSETLLADVRSSAQTLPPIPRAAMAAKLVNRGLQVAVFAVVLHALTPPAHAGHALFANGLSMLGGIAGEFTPAQLGATDGVLAASASSLSVALAVALALASVVRISQVVWSAVGGALALAPRREGR
ncbi:MAG: flippase-like domain-containing protein [Polyangiaceae bacterium]|nr:flippase-like domain-containing protein [Polyangiaceae bacterium]